MSEQRPIETCLENHLDEQIYAKFLQVLSFVGEKITTTLFRTYNEFLINKIRALHQHQHPPDYSLQQHVALMINFYSFRFIGNIAQYLVEKHRKGDEKAERNVTLLMKVLLTHGLVARNVTANFALVELEQISRACGLTLPQAYNRHRLKFLRLIIKGILQKLINHGDQCPGNGLPNGPGSSQLKRTNCVIAYMTRAFEIFNVSMITSDDIAQSLIIITNLIQKDKYTLAIGHFLDHVASYQRIDMYTLIRSHIQTIMVNLLLRRKMSHYDMTESLKKLCLFFQKTPKDVLATKFTSIKGRLLLHYSTKPKVVTDAVYYLSTFEKNVMDQPFEDEFEDEKAFIEYLKPSMIGILLGVDAYFTSIRRELGSEGSIESIDSLSKLISMLGKDQIQTMHHKLLSTLSLLVRLRPNRDNQSLNQAIIALWREFLLKMDRKLKDSLLVNISVALYDLIEDCPIDVSKIYFDLIRPAQKQPYSGDEKSVQDNHSDSKENTFIRQLKCLFFIPNRDGFESIYEMLTPHVYRNTVLSNFHELSQTIESVLPLLKYENQKCHLIAVTRIRDLLRSNQKLLTESMLVSSDEPLNGTISKTIESLLSVSSTLDSESSAIIAECLGILGAVNPVRLDHFIYGGPSSSRLFSLNLANDDFIIDLIERLKNSLFSDRVSESETANYALQVVVKTYDIIGKSIQANLSEEAVRACNLCKDTSYIGTKRTPPDMKQPVYSKFKNDNQYSYKEWLDKFSLVLISVLQDSRVQEVLHACTYTFKHNVKLAEYILPMVVIHIILQQPDNIDVIEREFMAIVNEDIGLSSQDVDTVYGEDIRSNLQTLHFQCANMMFCALDALDRLERLHVRPSKYIDEDQINSLRQFNASIPKDKLAILSSKCRAYARALYYFDQYYFETKRWPLVQQQKPIKCDFDKYWTELQKVFMALDETFEASGIESIRGTCTTLSDDIANYESLGKFDRATVCYDALLDSLDERVDKISIYEDALRCLSNQGDFQRLYERSDQLIKKFPHYKRSLLPAAIEAMCNLGKWDELNETFKVEQLDSLLESASVGKGFLLTSLNQSRREIPERLKLVRNRLMKPLSIAMIDRSAYFRGYQSLIVLHEIEDFSLTLDASQGELMDTQNHDENSADDARTSLTERLQPLFENWAKRTKLVEPTMRSLEPLISWQRSIAQALIKKHPVLQPQITIEIGKMWLTSARIAREARCFDRAFYCITQAHKSLGSEVLKSNLDLRADLTIEQAKLDWDQGESTNAIRGLNAALQRLKHLGLYEHLQSRRFIMEESKRSSSEVSAEGPYPDLSGKLCEDCKHLEERKSFAKMMTLLTRFSEEAAACTPKKLLEMYEECVHLSVNQEEILLHLARYYDKLATHYSENPHVLKLPENAEFDGVERARQQRKSLSQERLERQAAYREEIITKLMEQSILAFGNSLRWNPGHLEESMPRMLNIWLDLGSKKCGPINHVENNTRASFASPPRSISSRIENTVRFVDTLLPRKDKGSKGLPSFYYMSALSLLLSRVHHPHSGVCEKTIKILEQLTVDYPHQMVWHLIALMNDLGTIERRRAAEKIIKGAVKRDPRVTSIIADNRSLATALNLICIRMTPYDDRGELYAKQKYTAFVTVDQIDPSIKKLKLKQMKAIVPVQASMRPIFPTASDGTVDEKYNIFPEHNMTYAYEMDHKFKVYNSLQAPKQVDFRCRNGTKLSIICKSGDDLRKDSRCTEFFDLLNKILRRSSQSNVRFFEVPTYLVLPLRNHAGLIEMVPDCQTFRSTIDNYYKQRGRNICLNDGLKKRQRRSEVPDYQVYKQFIRDALPRVTPPVFQHFLKNKFAEPTSWYMARMAYIRSTATASMGGYIIGLGDRHLDNILIDIKHGRVVHVDFNLLFHQGETLAVPEIVPFRLTQNVIAGFGPLEKEGKFRKFCEIALREMRNEKELLVTALKPILHDPCVDWLKQREGNKSTRMMEEREGNSVARERIKIVENKLKGYPRSGIHRPLNVLSSHSVESQVDILIEEAADIYNISQMYHGWCGNI